jgi:hypothetical protein
MISTGARKACRDIAQSSYFRAQRGNAFCPLYV